MARRRPTSTTSGCWPATTRRAGWPTASSTRSSRTGSPTATRPTTSPTAPGPIAGASPGPARWDELPVRDGGSLVEFYGGDLAGIEAASRPPRRPGRQRHLPQPDLRDALEPRLRHHRLRPGRRPLRRRRGADRAAARDRASATSGCCSTSRRTTSGSSTRGSRRPRPMPRRTDRRLFRLPRAAGRLRVVAGRPIPAQARLPERGSPGSHVRGSRRRDAPLVAAAVRRGRLADRRRQHARPPGGRPARARGRARDARRGQGRNHRMPTCSASIRSMPPRNSPATSGTGS